MFVKIVDNPPHDGRWYSSMIGEVIEVTYDDIDGVYEVDNAEKLYPQEFDDDVVGLYLSPDDVQVL